LAWPDLEACPLSVAFTTALESDLPMRNFTDSCDVQKDSFPPKLSLNPLM
ncbi:hypothetical protein L9F63_007823, partial [Diploptera punctata]